MDRDLPVDENTVTLPGGADRRVADRRQRTLATGIAMALVFVPPAGTQNVLNYEVNLIGQAAILIGIGMFFYWSEGKKSRDHPRIAPFSL